MPRRRKPNIEKQLAAWKEGGRRRQGRRAKQPPEQPWGPDSPFKATAGPANLYNGMLGP